MVLTSGYSNVLAESAQGFELIQKPYSVELLSRILRKAISEARAAQGTTDLQPAAPRLDAASPEPAPPDFAAPAAPGDE